MTRSQPIVILVIMAKLTLLIAMAMCALFAGCADSIECGAGTVEVDGACVPNAEACGEGTSYNASTGQCEPDDNLTCAAGTIEENGECVADGSVICETGTTYDSETGTCVPDITGCAEGTVLVGGECIPADDALEADVTEPAEPNDAAGTPGTFMLQPAGEVVTISGCITPVEDADANGNLDPDFDDYTFSTDAPMLVDVTVDGLGGLAGAFTIVSENPALVGDSWARLGVNLVSDTSRATVFLPVAGDYRLSITDSRSLILGEGAGGADACYFASVATVALPAPTELAGGAGAGTLGAPAFFAYDPGEGAALFIDVNGDSEAASGAMTVLVNGSYALSVQPRTNGFAWPAQFVGGLHDADDVTVVVESLINYSLSPVAFDVTVTDQSAGPAPQDGTIDLIAGGGEYLYFDAAAGDVVRLLVGTPSESANLTASTSVINAAGDALGSLCLPGSCASASHDVQLPEAGRYHLRIATNAAAGASYQVLVVRDHVQPTPVAAGTSLEDSEDRFYELAAPAPAWLAITMNGPMSLDLDGYDRQAAGVLGTTVGPLFSDFFDKIDTQGRIFPAGAFLLRPDSFLPRDIAITERPHTALGAIASGSSVTLDGESVAASGLQRYLAAVKIGAEVTITITPDAAADATLTVVEADESARAVIDDGGAGAVESFTYSPSAPFTAFQVAGLGGSAMTYDVTVSIAAP